MKATSVANSGGNKTVLCAVLLACVFFFIHALPAQSLYGSITGTVTDPTGAVVPGAKVTMTDVATDEKRSTQSDSAGIYQFVSLVPAVYRVEVENPTFKRYVRDQVQVEVNTTTRVNAMLEVGAVNETVEVSSQGTMLQTDSGTLSNKIEGEQVQEMPLNGRNVMNLMELVPGVIPTNAQELQTGMNQGGTGTNPGGWNGFTTNGDTQDSNIEYLDGSPLNVLQGNNITLVPTQDSVQEFSVDTNATSADTGRGTGGIVNFTSRTGTNAWHGSVYEYFRNADLNANTFFNNQQGVRRPEWNQNQYGFNLGLPIRKDKVFFFGSWEVFDIKTSIPLTTNVPTQAMLNGVFTRQITDPLAPGDGCVITQGNSGGQNTWTLGAGCLDPTAQVMKNFFAAPNSTNPSFNYIYNEPDGDHQNQENVRMDFNLSPRQRLFVHQAWWHIQDVPSVPFPSNTQFRLGQEAATFNNNLGIVGDTLTLNPKTIVDLRASYLRFFFGAFSNPSNVDLSQFGPNYAALNALVPAGNHWIPEVNLDGSGAVHNIYNVQNNEGMQQHWDTYSINGSVTHLIGKHSIKAGGEARLMDLEVGVSQFNTGNTTYGINFSNTGCSASTQPAGCGDEFADFLMGYFKTATFGGGYPATNYSYYQGYYLLDTWQANQKLTLNLGLRWELPGGMAEKKNSTAVLLPYSVDPNTLAYGTESLVTTPTYPQRSVYAVHHDLLDPRLGFAYRLDNQTVVRGGFGITNQSVDLNSMGSGPAGAVVNSATATSTNNTTVVTRLSNPFPQGVVEPSRRSNPAFMQTLMQNSAGSGGYAASGYYPFIKYPYVEQWNLTVQRQFKSSTTSISYVGTHGLQLKDGGPIDEIPASAYTVTTTNAATGAQTATATRGTYAGQSLAAKTANNGTFCTSNLSVCNTNWLVGQTLEPYPNYKNFTVSNLTYGNQHYNALQVTSRLHTRAGAEIGGAYTWAKTIGDANGNNTYQDLYNHHADRSVSGTPMRLAVNYVLPLPFGDGQRFAHFSGVADKFVSGWQFNGITSFQHGSYLALTTNTANQLNQHFGAGVTRPNYTAGCAKTVNGSAVARLNQWFNTSCYVYPGDYTYGNESVYDPQLFAQGQDNWDIGLLKSTNVTERAKLQFRAETFNIFNRFQAGSPNTAVGNPSFGKVTSQANTPRLIQLSLRVSF